MYAFGPSGTQDQHIGRSEAATKRCPWWRSTGVVSWQQRPILLKSNPSRSHVHIPAHVSLFSSEPSSSEDVQSAWLFLLHCACARANYLLRVVRPSAAAGFAETHDQAVWDCLANILRTDLSVARRRHAPSGSWRAWFEEGHTSQRPCSLGQMGRLLGDGPCTPPRRRDVVGAPSGRRCHHPLLGEVRHVAHDLFEVGFEPHSWRVLLAGARPERNEVDEFEWGCGIGWQHEAASRVERHHRDDHIFPHLTDPDRALLLSQGGPGSGLAFSTCPTCRITGMGAQHFRIPPLALRRLQLPLPLTVRSCRCVV